MKKKTWALKGYALIILFLGPILVGISLQSVFQKIDIIKRMSVDMENVAPEADFTFTSTGDCSDQIVSFTIIGILVILIPPRTIPARSITAIFSSVTLEKAHSVSLSRLQ